MMFHDAVQELVERQAIVNVFNRYADALDFKKWDELERLFTPDATAAWFGDSWSQDNRDDIIKFIRSFLEEVATHHILGNHVVSISGDRATASCRVRAYHAGVGDNAHLFEESLAHFSGELVRVDKEWRFTRFTETLMVMLGTSEVFGDAANQ